MSSDLLAEFDTFYNPPKVNSHQEESFLQPSTEDGTNPWADISLVEESNDNYAPTLLQRSRSEEEEWGEFESGRTNDLDSQQIDFVDSNVWQDVVASSNSRGKGAGYEFNSDSKHKAALNSTKPTPKPNIVPEGPARLQIIENRPPRDENVLFDVEDEVYEDDFGEFESAEQEESSTSHTNDNNNASATNSNTLLIDFGDDMAVATKSSKTIPSFGQTKSNNVEFFGEIERQPSVDGSSHTKEDLGTPWSGMMTAKESWESWESEDPSPKTFATELTSQQAEQALEACSEKREDESQDGRIKVELDANEEYWDDFEMTKPMSDAPKQSNAFEGGLEHSKTEQHPAATRIPAITSSEAGIDIAQLLKSPEKPSALPPANIPPPALLLPLFAPIFTDFHSNMQKLLPYRKDDHREDRMTYSEELTQVYVNSYLTVATVLARMIAGRKLRWKRDTLLSQSMSLGPASSRKGSGMKLVGIDKGEGAKEDREVADSVKSWKVQLGRLRTIAAEAGVGTPIPDISETLPVRIAQQSEGGISSSKPCALCGLKRNERVHKADSNVHDDFGEYWHEHWGHKSCLDFWYTYRSNLQQR